MADNCPICGTQIGLFNGMKLNDTIVCNNCWQKRYAEEREERVTKEANLGKDLQAKKSTPGTGLRGLGIFLLITSAAAMAIGFTMDITAPYSNTINLGLLDERRLILGASATLFIMGTILYTAGVIVSKPQTAGQTVIKTGAPAASKLCLFCAEEIREAAIYCKHCQKDLPRCENPIPRNSEED